MLIWHYTFLLDEILECGVIPEATKGFQGNERPLVWFSTNQEWERAVRRHPTKPQAGPAELTALGFPVGRIGVLPETAPHNWAAIKRLVQIHNRDARRLFRAALEAGADPMQWRAATEPVARAQWMAIERFTERGWELVGAATELWDRLSGARGVCP